MADSARLCKKKVRARKPKAGVTGLEPKCLQEVFMDISRQRESADVR